MAIVEIDHVTKEFHLGQLRSLRQTLMNGARRIAGKPVDVRPPFKALDEVTFNIDEGEVVGIIGHNGAGKSTLLKLLANISPPTRGRVTVRGRVAPLIEVGAGLVGDLSGRENIFLNATILGMRRAEIARKFDEIVAFGELEEFIDTPIKRYSSGMAMRLGFSIATSADADILIVDEVLAVGDLAFQRKCFDRMEDIIKRQGKTVLLVSHNIRQVERLCKRVMLFDHGKMILQGNPTEVCNAFFEQSNQKIKDESTKLTPRGTQITDDIAFEGLELFDEDDQRTERVECLHSMRVRATVKVLRPLSRICFLIGTHTTDFLYLTASNTVEKPRDYEPGTYAIDLNVKAMTLLPGVYSFRVWIGTPEGKVSFYGENLRTFTVYSDDHLITRQQEMGLIHLESTWNLGGYASCSDLHSASVTR